MKVSSNGQIARIFDSLKQRPKTMLQVARETNIERANVCRYIDKFRKAKKVQLVRKGICPISKARAGFYTTDSNLFT
ncbi:hypothetical protein [Soonwooa sp.]|uniref:hypothetical protein n=1 Tax=Soonwooa sp. TaxID=1938592 RepID=UPI0028A86B69|nr:hypothetical protein [Soonwooa sp.]